MYRSPLPFVPNTTGDDSQLMFAPWSPTGPRPRPLALVRESAPDYSSFRDPAGERADALLDLGDRIAELERSIGVAQAEMMRLVVEFDDARGWEDAGFPNCAEWLAWRTGMGRNAARERVRTAGRWPDYRRLLRRWQRGICRTPRPGP